MLLSRLTWHLKVAVPRLVFGALERQVEPDLDELVLGPQHRLGYRFDPRVRHELGKPADLLGMDLDVPALRSARYGAALTLPGRLERGHHVMPHSNDPFAWKRTLAGGDAIPVDRLDVPANVGRRELEIRRHDRTPRAAMTPLMIILRVSDRPPDIETCCTRRCRCSSPQRAGSSPRWRRAVAIRTSTPCLGCYVIPGLGGNRIRRSDLCRFATTGVNAKPGPPESRTI